MPTVCHPKELELPLRRNAMAAQRPPVNHAETISAIYRMEGFCKTWPITSHYRPITAQHRPITYYRPLLFVTAHVA